MPEIFPDSTTTSALLVRIEEGTAKALEGLLARHCLESRDFNVGRRLDPAD